MGSKYKPKRVGFKPRQSEVALALFLLLIFAVSYRWYPDQQLQQRDDGSTVVKVKQSVRLGNEEEDDGGDAEEYPEQSDEEARESLRVARLGDDDDQIVAERRQEMEMKSIELMEKVLTGEQKLARSSLSSKQVAQLGGLWFKDGDKYEAAPNVTIPDVPLAKKDYARLWYLQKMHDEFFEKYPHKNYIPTLDQPVSRQEFYETFIQTSTPVIVPFEHMRHLGLLTKGYTIDELRDKFPYAPKAGAKVLNYHAKAGLNGPSLDLGPALYELSKDAKLAKGAKGTSLRNFPRNLMIKPKYLALLDVTFPPFLPKSRFQVPTLWMGTSTADTKLHHDCCDNFVMMIAGTKRWFIAPPPDSRVQRPVLCSGKHQSLCWSSLKYPNIPREQMTEKDRKILDSLQYFTVDLQAGHMLFLPAGWWHHIENLGPTVMVNFWTRGCSNSAVALDADPIRRDRPDFQNCPAVARSTNDFLSS